jgi:hypothetical protein
VSDITNDAWVQIPDTHACPICQPRPNRAFTGEAGVLTDAADVLEQHPHINPVAFLRSWARNLREARP